MPQLVLRRGPIISTQVLARWTLPDVHLRQLVLDWCHLLTKACEPMSWCLNGAAVDSRLGGMLYSLAAADACRNIVHRSVEPAHIQFFEKQKRWLLADFSKWARRGTESPVVFSLRHAAPEVGGHVPSHCAYPPATSRRPIHTSSMHGSKHSSFPQHQTESKLPCAVGLR